MSYFTIDDINALVPDNYRVSAADDNREGSVTATVWASIVSSAEDEVNAYLERRYTLPLSAVPAVVKRAACWFCLQILFSRRNVANDFVKDQSAKYSAILESIANGELPLNVSDNTTELFDEYVPKYNDEEREEMA